MSWASRHSMSNFGVSQDSGLLGQRDLDQRRSMGDGMTGLMQSNMGGRGMNRLMNQDNGNRGYNNQNDRFKSSNDYGNYGGNRGGNRNQQASPDEFETGIPLHLDKFSGSFDVMTKVCGSTGENLDYIEKTTGAKLRLVGRGTVDPMTGRASTEPAQIMISHPEMKGLELTEQLVESLLKSVQDDYQEHLESEYKSMENMLGLEGDQMAGGSNIMQNNQGYMGNMATSMPTSMATSMAPSMAPSRPKDQTRYCTYCDINCRDVELYAIHCNGALHRQKLQEREVSDRAQNQMGRPLSEVYQEKSESQVKDKSRTNASLH